MQRVILISCLFLMFSFILPAIELDIDSMAIDGNWQIVSNRLVQLDVDAGKAKFAIPLTQRGNMVYEFNVKYEGGVLEDGHGGFGIHVFTDSVLEGEAWGAGTSWLLWLNYDIEPEEVLPGLSAQIYQSVSHSEMEIIAEYDLNGIVDYYARQNISADDILAMTFPVKIVVNGNTGMVRIYDPFIKNYYYSLTLPLEESLYGEYVVLRTNGMSVSFAQ